ncbi:hypothetical protein KKG29_03135, partial [Patescibacteria group bacterium]|nr:hypothetical protein [Patescibacteria group bacterium]
MNKKKQREMNLFIWRFHQRESFLAFESILGEEKLNLSKHFSAAPNSRRLTTSANIRHRRNLFLKNNKHINLKAKNKLV